jgi:hypothetical protein
MPYSDELKVFWFTPIRSGTRSVEKLLMYFNFSDVGNHDLDLNEQQKNYFLISNIRNPYSRLVSIYNLFCLHSNKKPDNFKLWVERRLTDDADPSKIVLNYQTDLLPRYFEKIKFPNYCVKIESFEKDIRNIPFIKENITDELNSIIEENIVSNRFENEFSKSISWQNQYDDETAELVFNFLEKEFITFGYNKNSWLNGAS